jgi:hypothetical protein
LDLLITTILLWEQRQQVMFLILTLFNKNLRNRNTIWKRGKPTKIETIEWKTDPEV